LIGVSDHEKIALKGLFSPYLIPSLHPDLQHHIMSQLHVDIQQLAEEFQQSHPDLVFGHQDESPGTNNNANNRDNTQVVDSEEHADPNADGDGDTDGDMDADVDVDADANLDTDVDADAHVDDDDRANSGFCHIPYIRTSHPKFRMSDPIRSDPQIRTGSVTISFFIHILFI
jgi:hypothetical protein